MSKQEVIRIETPQVRSLTRGEVKRLRESGADPAFGGGAEATGKLIDFVMDVYKGEAIAGDDVPYDECLAFAVKVYEKTYGAVKQEKN